jgi:hypothetical protein
LIAAHGFHAATAFDQTKTVTVVIARHPVSFFHLSPHIILRINSGIQNYSFSFTRYGDFLIDGTQDYRSFFPESGAFIAILIRLDKALKESCEPANNIL